MKLQIIIDDVVGEPVTLDGPGIFPYARAITGFSQLLVNLYSAENPSSTNYLTISGAEVSLKSRTRTRRRA